MGFLFFGAVIGYAFWAMMLLPKLKAGQALLVSVSGMLFASFWVGVMAECLVPMAWGLMIPGLGGLAAGIVCAILNKRNMRSRMASAGLWYFVLACAALAVQVNGVMIQDHDSLSFWLRSVRELFTFDRFYVSPETNMYHMDYIPLLSSLEYAVVRVFGWQDAYTLYVPIACFAASLAAMADAMPRRLRGLMAAPVLALSFYVFGFQPDQLRADGAMLAVFVSALACLFAREDDSAASLLPTVAAAAVLTGFKIYSGLMFSVVLVLALLVEVIRTRKGKALLIVAIVCTLALQFGWSIKYNLAMGTGAALGGNPRTAQLMTAFTGENIAMVSELIRNTWTAYATSTQVWIWPAVIAVLALAMKSEKRGAALKMLLFGMIASVIYLLGLFASYFVQSETSGAATNYLATASTLLFMLCVFLSLWLMEKKLTKPAAAVALVLIVGIFALRIPVWTAPEAEDTDSVSYAEHAIRFYQDDLDGLLRPEDQSRRALVIDASYDASLIKSQSGKTHSYQYFALPMRVMEPLYFTYGDYQQLDSFDPSVIEAHLEAGNCDLLLLRVEDELYWEAICDGLGLDWDMAEPIGAYDVSRTDDGFTFAMREYE